MKKDRGSKVVYRITPHTSKLDDYELPSEVPLDPKKMKPNRFAGKVKFTHGGARTNAGRKRAPEQLVAKRVYLYPRHVKALEKIDKNVSAAIRKLVDAAQK